MGILCYEAMHIVELVDRPPGEKSFVSVPVVVPVCSVICVVSFLPIHSSDNLFNMIIGRHGRIIV